MDPIMGFLGAVYSTLTDEEGTFIVGQLAVWSLPRRATHWCPSTTEAAKVIEKLSGQGEDVYIHTALHDQSIALAMARERDRAEGKDPALRNPSNVRGCEKSAVALPGLWLDEDHAKGEHQKANLPPDLPAVIEFLGRLGDPLTPSLLVNSGGGIQAWFLFDKPLMIEADGDRERAKALTRGLHHHIARSIAPGFSHDQVFDLARVLRPAGTRNQKYGSDVHRISADGEPLPDHSPVVRRPIAEIAGALAGHMELPDRGSAAPVTRVVNLVIDPEVEPSERVAAFIAQNDAIQYALLGPQMWSSQSEADMSLACQLVMRGFSDQEIADALIWYRNSMKGEGPKHPGYYTRTLEKAREFIASLDPPVSTGKYEPFPTSVFHPRVAGVIETFSAALGCDATFIAMPLLAQAGAAIGNTTEVEIKRGWCEPPVIWTATVAESGTMKSPAMDKALRPVSERQRKAFRKYELEMEDHTQEMIKHGARLAEWKKSGPNGPPPLPPKKPVLTRLKVTDATAEAVAAIHADNPRGILLVRDELSGWMKGFNQYKAGKGGDAAFWLEVYGARPVSIDRKTGDRPVLHIPRAAICVTGGIQPGILLRELGQEHQESGFAARMFLAMPPRRRKQWTDDEIPPDVEEELCEIMDNLYDIPLATFDDGTPKPARVGLTELAKLRFRGFYERHSEEQAEQRGPLAAAYAKLEGGCARIALVLHMMDRACGETDSEAISDDVMARAVEVVEWLKNETRRIYARLGETEHQRELRELTDKIPWDKGWCSLRAWQRCRSIPAERATEDFERLVTGGVAKWHNRQPGPTGGRPSRGIELLNAEVLTERATDKTSSPRGASRVSSDVRGQDTSQACTEHHPLSDKTTHQCPANGVLSESALEDTRQNGKGHENRNCAEERVRQNDKTPLKGVSREVLSETPPREGGRCTGIFQRLDERVSSSGPTYPPVNPLGEDSAETSPHVAPGRLDRFEAALDADDLGVPCVAKPGGDA